MEFILHNSTQACCWPAYKGPVGLRAFPYESTRHRRRGLLTRNGYHVHTYVFALSQSGARHWRLSTSAAAAAPATPGSGDQRKRNVPPPSSQPQLQPSPLQPATTQFQAQQPQLPQQPQQPWPHNRKPRFRLLPEDPNDRQRPEDNPSLDDIVLDEQYYKEMGLNKEEVLEALRQLDATEVDPEGVNLGPSGLQAWPPSADGSGAPSRNCRTSPLELPLTTGQETRLGLNLPRQQQQQWQQQLTRGSGQDDGEDEGGEDADLDDELAAEGEEEEEEDGAWAEQQEKGDGPPEERRLLSPFGGPGLGLASGPMDAEPEDDSEVYGPEAVVLAGFRPEEHGMVRALLDSAGGHVVKVLPVTEAMLYGTVDEAVHSAEQDWSAPRPPDGPRGGGWGAQRTLLFSGLSLRAQLTVLELVESSGIPAVCAAAAEQEQAGRRLGEVLAEAVAVQRSQANRLPKQEEPWREAAAASGRVADARQGLTPLEDLIGPKAQERLLHLQQFTGGDEDDEDTCDAKVTVTTTSALAATAAGTRVGSVGGGGAAAAAKGPILESFGLEAAEAAAADWEAWRASRAASAAAGWGLDLEESAGAGTAPDSYPDLDRDPAAGVPNLADLGVDLEKLREQVLHQLADLDLDTLDELLVDSPYGDAAGDAVAQWRRAQEEGQGMPPTPTSPAVAPTVSTAAVPGLTVDDVGRLAEQQRRRWQDVQASLESAVAAAGQLVVQAESSLLMEVAAPPPPPLQEYCLDPSRSPESSSGPVGPLGDWAGPPASASAAAAVPAAAAASAATAAATAAASAATASAATSPATQLQVGASAMDNAVYNTPDQQKQPHQRQKAPVALTPEQFHPRQQPPPLPPLPAFDLFGVGGASSSFSELDDLLGQLTPPSGGLGAARATEAAGGGFGAAAPASSSAPAPLSFFDVGRSLQATKSDDAAGFGGAAVSPSASAAATAASPTASGGGDGGGGGILQQVREAARSGAAPEEIQRMLDERYGVASLSPPPQPPDPRATLPPASPSSSAVAAAAEEPGAVPKRRRGSLFAGLKSAKAPAAAVAPPSPQGAPAVRARTRRSYGPSPPPEPDPVMKPLLELRPDIAKAVQEKKVQFLDLSRLNDNQKRQFVEYQERLRLQQQVQQQEKQQLAQQLEQQQQQQSRQWRQGGGDLRGPGMVQSASSSKGMQLGQGLYGGRGLDKEYDGEEDECNTEGDVEEDQEEGESEASDEDEDEGYGTSLDAEKLRELMEASQEEGLGLEGILAQAVAMGVRLPDEVLRQAGVSPPSEEALARARDDYNRMFMQWAAEGGVAMPHHDPQTAEAGSGPGPGPGDDTPPAETKHLQRAVAQQQLLQLQQQLQQQQQGGGSGGMAFTGGGGSSSISSSSRGSSRPWGSGLAARRRPLRPTGSP